MTDVTVVKYSFEGMKFEILVKPDPALEYKLGKRKDIYIVSRPIMLPLLEKRLKSRYNIDANFETVTNIHNSYNVYRNAGVRSTLEPIDKG